ncbi:MAG: TIGR03936 family radical SAM-associated protein [Defluviitaleaceae bacterium]|nr:TIGR03936 family radical SAM-associated protein [Defluviitaleaceae bacterium]
MNNLLLRFSKTDRMVFIGHLDLLKVFQTAVRRAGLAAAYSKGFNPHMLLTFALPLPLGAAGYDEHALLVTERGETDAAARLNRAMPDGLKITESRMLDENEKPNAAARVAAADYSAEIIAPQNLAEQIAKLLSSEKILIEKKSKSKTETADIKPLIHYVKTDGEKIFMRLAAGSAKHLNPTSVLNLICDGYADVTRLRLLSENRGEFGPLFL